MTPSLFRKFLFFRLPIAWVAGLRLKTFSENQAEIKVKLGKMNQNPFKSMFWAVEGMAAELSTGVLAQYHIQKSGKKMSFLVTEQNGQFFKKAVGKIVFSCNQGEDLKNIIQKATDSGKGETLKVYSIGRDESGDVVAEFWFLWSFKVK